MNGRFFRTFFGSYKEESLTGSTKDILHKILEGKLSDVKTASFLVFLKYNGSPYIFGKAVDVLREKIEKIDLFLPDSIEIGYPYKLKKIHHTSLSLLLLFSPFFQKVR